MNNPNLLLNLYLQHLTLHIFSLRRPRYHDKPTLLALIRPCDYPKDKMIEEINNRNVISLEAGDTLEFVTDAGMDNSGIIGFDIGNLIASCVKFKIGK